MGSYKHDQWKLWEHAMDSADMLGDLLRHAADEKGQPWEEDYDVKQIVLSICDRLYSAFQGALFIRRLYWGDPRDGVRDGYVDTTGLRILGGPAVRDYLSKIEDKRRREYDRERIIEELTAEGWKPPKTCKRKPAPRA